MKVIRVEPLTRVEGHGRVDLYLNGGQLQRVQLSFLESPRFFENLVRQRPLQEIPALVCRICSICSAVHRIAAVSALERALQMAVPPMAEMVRELLLLGGLIESHALHLFCLIYPDLRGSESLLPLIAQGDSTLATGLGLKRLANRIQEVAGGRAIHPVTVEVGGIVSAPQPATLQRLLDDVEEMAGKVDELMHPFVAGLYPAASAMVASPLTVASDKEFSLYGDRFLLGDGRYRSLSSYPELLREQGGDGPVQESEIFYVGALARQENRQQPQGHESGRRVLGIHANNPAQGVEIVTALARCRTLILELLALKGDEPGTVPLQLRSGIGTAVIEAPRGLLIHHYVVDDRGKIVAAEIVTPTAINQRAIEAQLFADLQGVAESEIDSTAQRIVRAFDPCISCAVHLIRI